MYQLFVNKSNLNAGVIRPPGFELVRRIYQREIASIIEYYHTRVFYCNNTHILVRLLRLLSAPISYELDRYTEVINTRSPYIAKTFGITSSINYGITHEGVFYGDSNKEILIYDDSYFNPYEVVSDWKNIRAVNVLDHPVSDLSLLIPNGKSNSTDKGLAVISINVPLLCIQYRQFLLEQQTKEVQLSLNHFINMYVLPNMLYSHIEIVLLNRLLNLYYGKEMGVSTNRFPKLIIDYTDKTDMVLTQVLKHLTNSHMLDIITLKNIPSFYDTDMSVSLLIPDIALTRQVKWGLVLSRLKIMKFLVLLNGTKGGNGIYLRELQVMLSRMLNDKILETRLDKDLYASVMTDINIILTNEQ